MTTFRLDADDPKLPANATAGDIVTYGDDAYRLYEDPQRGLPNSGGRLPDWNQTKNSL